jgi:hypothetical protein
MLSASYLYPMPNTLVNSSKFILHWVNYRGISTIVFWLSLTTLLFSQRPNYSIEVALDTKTNELSGVEVITYRNQTPGTLDSLGIHLWANAYADKNSTFAKQLLNLGNFEFKAARPDELGGYQQINFSSSDDNLDFHYEREQKDIGWIIFSKPLLPGEEISIKASFVIKVPLSFSRLGRTDDSYQFTQWYPHIAVYDLEGWHTMPYLDQGEYFNDFADYQVSITVPSGYIIASTGMIKDKQEEGELTTWHFTADNVIDFAWFASPHFRVTEKSIQVENGNPFLLSIYADTLSTDPWDSVIFFAERALTFYSDWLGPYPYPHMSVVSAPWSKGGFMEYPMLAQIGTTPNEDYLDIVIAHEIGHTWLYGILANDERSYPWLDEGLNTFFDRKYTKQYHHEYRDAVLPDLVRTSKSMPDEDALQHILTYKRKLQPPASDPQFQSSAQYLFSAYLLPAVGLEMMESRLGPVKMKAMSRQYFQDQQFSHVDPVDLRVSFEKKCACDLSWFFDSWIRKTGQMDYRITKFKPKLKEVTVINKGDPDLPLQITSYRDGKQVSTYWLNGFRGEKIFHLDQRSDEVKLFKDEPEVNKIWWRNTVPGKFLPNITIIPKVGSYERSSWSINPFLGHNLSDGIMLGPVIVNDFIPQRHFKWTIAPLYGFESKKIRGYAEGRFSADFYKGIFDKMLISFSVNHFGYDVDTHYSFRDSYLRLSPSIGFRLANEKETSHLAQWWKYRYVNIDQFYGEGIDPVEKTFDRKTRTYDVHELAYSISSDYAPRPYKASINSQVGKGFLKFNLNYHQHFAGNDKKKGIWVHAFGGWQSVNDQRLAETRFTLSGIPSLETNSFDYMYDEWLGGRNAESGLYAQQVFMKDAGFKTLAFSDVSSTWMTAAGLSYALPFKMFHLYMDAAMYRSDLTLNNEISYSGGIALIILKDVFEVYFPLVESKDIRESITYEEKDIWYERISFQANIRLMNPMDALDRATLRY